MDGDRDIEEGDRARERRVVELARELAETINAGRGEERDVLREMAVNVVRDNVDTELSHTPAGASKPTGKFNAFGIGIPLVLMGAVLIFLFPLVGLLMFGAAAVMIAWGVGTTLLARS